MKFGKRCQLVSGFICALICSLSLSTQVKSHSNKLVIQLSPTGIAPYADNSPADNLAIFQGLVQGQLLSIDQDFNLRPALIESWKWLPGTNSYILKLKKGVKFHNGREINAKDLEFSLLRGFFSKGKSYFRMTLGEILDVDQIKEGSSYRSGSISGVEVVDDLTVKLTLSTKNRNFLYNLVRPYYSIVPPEALKDDYLSWKTVPIGAGPFRVSQKFDGSKTLLTRVSGDSGVAAEVISLFTSPAEVPPEVSLSLLPLPHLNGIFQSSKPSAIFQIHFSYVNPLGADPRFRKAVSLLIDRSKMSSALPGGVPVNSLFPTSLVGKEQIPDPDPKQAQEIFESLDVRKLCMLVYGFKNDADASKNLRAMELVRQFKNIGIELSLKGTISKHGDLKEHQSCPFKISGIVSDFVDPTKMVAFFNQGSPYKYLRPEKPDPEFERLYKIATGSDDKAEVISTVKEIADLISSKNYAVPIEESHSVYYYNKDVIDSFGQQPQPIMLFVDRITLKGSKSLTKTK